MNYYPWFDVQEQLPVPNELVEVKGEVIFRGKYQPECKIAEWIAEDADEGMCEITHWRVIERYGFDKPPNCS